MLILTYKQSSKSILEKLFLGIDLKVYRIMIFQACLFIYLFFGVFI